MKAKIINFELLADFENDFREPFLQQLDKDLYKLSTQGIEIVYGLYPMEGILPYDDIHFEEFFQKISQFSKKYGIKIILLSNLSNKFFNIQTDFECLYFSFMLRITYNNYKKIQFNKEYNYSPNRFLFLGGVSSRKNRILLMSKFYEKDLYKSMRWSFFNPVFSEDRNLCRQILSHYSDEEYKNFIKYSDRSIDNEYREILHYFRDSNAENNLEWKQITKIGFFNNPIYIDPINYSTTSFSIVSEGPNFWNDNWDFITEKTWKIIANKHPFIFAGHPDQFRHIKKLGFRTFENHLPIADYAYYENEEKRLDAVVTNVQYLLKNKDIRKNLSNDVEHNFQLFLKLAKKQEKFLNKLRKKFNISNEDFDKNFNSLGFSNLRFEI